MSDEFSFAEYMSQCICEAIGIGRALTDDEERCRVFLQHGFERGASACAADGYPYVRNPYNIAGEE